MSVLTFDHPAEVLRRRAELMAEYAHGRSIGLLEVRDLMLQDPAADTDRLAELCHEADHEYGTRKREHLRALARATRLAQALEARAELASPPAEVLTAGLEEQASAPHRRERTRPPRPRGRYCIARHIASNAPPAVVCPVPTQAPHGSAPPG